MTEDQIRELLREMRDDPVPADSLARVRMRVEERTAARRTRWWIPAVAFAVLAVLTVMFWPRHASRSLSPPAPVIAKVKPAEPRPVVATVTKPRLVRHRARPVSRVVASTAIRIETADPDVVLIMVTSGGED